MDDASFFPNGRTDEDALVLGHQGLLEYFTATFRGDDYSLDLQANRYFPGEVPEE